MKLRTILQIIRLLLKLGSCILYVAQTVPNENYTDSNYIYPSWCCQNTIITILKDSSQPPIDTILNTAVRNNNLCPSPLLYNNYRFSSLNGTFPPYSAYMEWETAGNCYRSNLTNSSCDCTLTCGVHHICANKIGSATNTSTEVPLCKFDETALEQPFTFLLKFIFYPKSVRIWIAQCAFGILDMGASVIISLFSFYAGRKWMNLIDMHGTIDILLGLMFTATLLFPPCLKNIFIPSFLQSISGVSIITWLVLDVDTFTTHRRFLTYNIQKCIIIILNVFAFIFISTCAIEYVERVKIGQREDSQPKNLAEATYLLLITITTVGYGDFSPGTWFGRALTLIVVFSVLLYLPGIIEEMLDTFKESGVYSQSVHSLSASKYIVICLSNPRLHFLLDFLREVYVQENTKLGTIILSPRVVDRMIETRMNSPMWRKRVLLLTGSALKSLDLERAGVKKCIACFVISDRHSDEPDASDQETILRAHSIHSFAPNCKLYVYLLKVEYKPLVLFASNVVCEGELKHAIFAASCVCPGFSTFISLLLHTTSAAPQGENAVYNYCSGNEIYDIVLRDSKLLKDMLGVAFINAVLFIHKKYGILLIAIQKHGSNEILLNPGRKVTLEPKDRLFYISQTNEEDEKGMEEMRRENESIQNIASQEILFNQMSIEESRDTDDPSTVSWTTLSPTSTDSPGQSSSNLIPFDSTVGRNPLSLDLGKDSNTGSKMVSEQGISLKQKYKRRSNKVGTRPDSKNVKIGAFSFTTHKAGDKIESSVKHKQTGPNKPPTFKNLYSQTSEDDFIISDYTSNMQPSQMNLTLAKGIPKQSLFMIPGLNKYHTTKSCYLCCLQIGWKYPCHESKRGIPVARRLSIPFQQELDLYHHSYKNPIIVIADEAGPQLYNFILPLRAAHIPKKNIHPIILLLPTNPNIRFLEGISCFPLIKFMTGQANNVEDLLIAGIVMAKLVILCLGDGTPTEKEEQHMTDASKIQTFLKYKQLFPRTRFLVEIFHRSNMEILCSKRSKSTDLNGFLTTPHFMSGQVFSPSLLDTILYQSAEKEYIIRLVRIMLGLEQVAGNRSLSSISRNVPELRSLRTYGDIMVRIAKEWDMLAIGIYQCEFKGEKDFETYEDYQTNIMPFIKDQLDNMNHAHKSVSDMKFREYAYKVLVNPVSNIAVYERDIILVIKSTEINEKDQENRISLGSSHSMSLLPEISSNENSDTIQVVETSTTDLESYT